ncbi:MAG: IS110 family transposase [Gammaproteobacteria bacterium]|nr:MAG: IS110 family transposase [Gammaproteobacteria bacterium]
MNQAGIDVSNETFDIQRRCGEVLSQREFANSNAGHRQAITWMKRGAKGARVCLEATGIYHLQLALALDRAPGIEVMVVNPRASRRFAEAQMVRAKTDKVDAAILLQYVERMPFTAWTAPADELLELQSLAHRLAQLKKEQVRERSRLHAAQRAGAHTRLAQRDLREHLRYLQRRAERIQAAAIALMKQHERLAEDLYLLDSVPGVAELSAMKLSAELSVLAQGLSPAQWVAQAGLDPRPQESGTSIRSPRRISKQGNAKLRAALFMPALAAIRKDPNVNAFYNALLARGKLKMQAITAVMRKLLHAIWGILKHRKEWDGSKFFRMEAAQTA